MKQPSLEARPVGSQICGRPKALVQHFVTADELTTPVNLYE